jgi:hypothetical protein
MNWKNNVAWRFIQTQATNTTTTKRRLTLLTIALALIAASALTVRIVVKAQDQKGRAPERGVDSNSLQAPARSAGQVQAQYEKVLQIKAETGLLPFSVTSGAVDVEPHGPSSLSVTDNGDFLIADKSDNSAVEIARSDGSVLSKTTFTDATALVDAISLAGRIYALDSNDGRPRILMAGDRINSKSKFETESADSQTVAQIAAESAPTKLSVSNEQLAVDTINGDKISGLDGVSSIRPNKSVPVVAAGNPLAPNANQLRVSIRGKQVVNLAMPNAIAEADLLGVESSGNFFVYVIELEGDQRLLLDHKVLWFSPSGALLGEARVPADERAFAVPNGTALAQDGKVYSLIPRPDGNTDIVRLVFGRSLPSFNPALTTPPGQQVENPKSSSSAAAVQAQLAATTLPQLTRSQITNNAWNFVNSTVWTSAANIGTTSSCPSRAIPAFLKGKPAGSYQVAYSWGGADTPADYNGKLSRGFLAGNAQGTFTQGCSVAGVDCSGFIGDVWQMWGHPFSTSTLPGSGTVRSITWNSLTSGDVLNWAGTHIMMYDRSDANSVWVWEATTDYGTGRVGYNQRPWRDVPSTRYLAWRYNGLPKPVAGITLNSSWGIAYENSYPTYTVSPGQTITFNLSSSRSAANSGTLTSWVWSVNGSTISTQPSTSKTLGSGTYTVSLKVTNSEGDTATTSLTIQINQVVIVPPPRIDSLNPSYVRRNVGTWVAVYGANFQRTMTVRVRTATGGPWVIAPSGVSYVNSGMVWVWVVMGGSGTYQSWLEIVQNGAVASRSFTVGP